MPIYEYECLECRQTFEVRRCFSEADKPANCDRCQSQNTHRLMSNFYAKSSGSSNPGLSGGHGGCGGCSGGSCNSCHH